LYYGKSGPKLLCYFCNFSPKEPAKVNNQPIGENSPNLVTLRHQLSMAALLVLALICCVFLAGRTLKRRHREIPLNSIPRISLQSRLSSVKKTFQQGSDD
jgi:hypothetical protein